MVRPLVARVGRLQRLAVFEAAARLGTFTAAAEELGMTQPAVTKHVRALEAGLGLTLFDRTANRASLSEAGRRLHRAVGQGFTTVEAELHRLADADPAFVLAANPGVAQRWLVPHLEGLRATLEDVDLRLWLFDRDAEFADGRFDAAIHAGDGHWPGFESIQLFPEVTVPGATPACARQRGLDTDGPAGALTGDMLLHLDPTDRPWMSWADWFTHHGLDEPDAAGSVVYNNYALVLQEALAGNGVALAWRWLVDDWLDQGILVTVGPDAAHPTSGYHLIWPEGRGGDAVERLAAWLTAMIDGGPAG